MLTNKEDRKDISSLKAKTLNLAHDLHEAGVDATNDATAYVQDGYDELKASGVSAIKRAEKHIKSKPGQSIAIAFIAGLAASFLLGRKS